MGVGNCLPRPRTTPWSILNRGPCWRLVKWHIESSCTHLLDDKGVPAHHRTEATQRAHFEPHRHSVGAPCLKDQGILNPLISIPIAEPTGDTPNIKHTFHTLVSGSSGSRKYKNTNIKNTIGQSTQPHTRVGGEWSSHPEKPHTRMGFCGKEGGVHEQEEQEERENRVMETRKQPQDTCTRTQTHHLERTS